MGLIKDIKDIEPIEPDWDRIRAETLNTYGSYIIVDNDMDPIWIQKKYLDYASINITAPEFYPKDLLIDGCSYD